MRIAPQIYKAAGVLLPVLLFAARVAAAQNAATTAATPHALMISILEGEGELNDVRARTAREPIVQVEDENHKPVAGALVLFALPRGSSPAATFSGLSSLTVRTGADGRAIGHGFRVTRQTGNFQIQVVATAGTLQAQIMIHEMNFAKGGKLARVKDYSANHATLTTTVVGLASFAAAASAIAVTSQQGATQITAGVGIVGR